MKKNIFDIVLIFIVISPFVLIHVFNLEYSDTRIKDSSKRSKNIQTKLLSPIMKKCSDLGSDYETVKYDGKN